MFILYSQEGTVEATVVVETESFGYVESFSEEKKYANPSESLLVTIDFFAFLRAFGVIHVVGCFFLSFELIAWGKIFKTEGLIFIS